MTVRARVESTIRRELPHLTAGEAADLACVLDRLVASLAPEQIYVFGSRARGTPTEHSDVDLLVVVSSSSEPAYRRAQQAYAAIGAHRLPVDILVWTREEFDERLAAAASLPATVAREGRLLYAA